MVPPAQFTFAVLKRYGVNAVRGPRRMPEPLLKALVDAARADATDGAGRGKRSC